MSHLQLGCARYYNYTRIRKLALKLNINACIIIIIMRENQTVHNKMTVKATERSTRDHKLGKNTSPQLIWLAREFSRDQISETE